MRAKAGGRDQLQSPIADMTCCHRPALRHCHRTRPDRLRWQRDGGQVGKSGREKPLCVARARHAGSEPS